MVLLAILVAIAIPMLSHSRAGALSASCAGTLKQFGLAFKMYARDSRGEKYPDMQGHPPWLVPNAPATTGCTQGYADGTIRGAFAMAPDMSVLYPKYITDPIVFQCPADRTLNENKHNPWLMMNSETPGSCAYEGYIASPDVSYQYIGYTLDNNRMVTADTDFPFPCASGTFQAPAHISTLFAHLFGKGSAASSGLDARLSEDVEVGEPNGTGGFPFVYRLREGTERFLVTDVSGLASSARHQASVPVMWDRVTVKSGVPSFHHIPEGCNVLFMDGHVEFISYPSNRFPCTTWWPKCQKALDMILNP
jgi:prepilin-type processing-associated H-X9-DG protein